MKTKTIVLLTIIALVRPSSLSATDVTGDRLKIGTSGGGTHSLAGTAASIAGGDQNKVNADYAFIGGGQQNTNTGPAAGIGSGYLNNIDAESDQGFIGGGAANVLQDALQSSILGGSNNKILSDSYASCICGGYVNTIQTNAEYSFLGAGTLLTICSNAQYSFLGGGWGNTISNDCSYAAIVGGTVNAIHSGSAYGFIGAGSENKIVTNCTASVIAGGIQNVINNSSGGAVIVGGGQNLIGTNSSYAAILGGNSNVVGSNCSFSVIPGGNYARALHSGCFVWGDDSTTAYVNSAAANQFVARASGGVTFYSNSGMSAGVTVAAGGGSWSSVSDRNMKENFRSADVREILDRLASVPVQSWNYKSQPASVRHIGVMAQDFYAAFRVGEDEKRISTVDADGVAMAAIQGLYQIVKDKESEITDLKKQMTTLREQVLAQQKESRQWEVRFVAIEQSLERTPSESNPASASRRLVEK